MSGFPLKWFVNAPNELICGKCKNVLNDPHQCKNGHLFCFDCLKAQQTCPTCKVTLNSVDLASSLLANTMVKSLVVKCKCKFSSRESNDCKWTGPLTERESHQCDYELKSCGHKGCKKVAESHLLSAHEAACEKRLIACELCNELCVFDRLAVHNNALCLRRQITCPCGTSFEFRELKSHKLNRCDLATIVCPLVAAGVTSCGCGGKLVRSGLDEHLLEQSGQLDTMKQLVARVAELREYKDLFEMAHKAKMKENKKRLRDEAALTSSRKTQAVANVEEPILPPPPLAEISAVNVIEHTDSVDSADGASADTVFPAEVSPAKKHKVGYEGARNKQGQKHGVGRLTQKGGAFYAGQWKTDKKHGQGVMRFNAGSNRRGEHCIGWRYEGTFRENRRCGQGICEYDNGDVYTGEWRVDLQCGVGRMVYADGRVFEGKWVSGKEVAVVGGDMV